MIDWHEEGPQIIFASMVHGVDPLFIATIRKVENGPPGKEFGVLVEGIDSYEKQLDVTCNSVRNEVIRAHPDKVFALKVFESHTRLCYTAIFIGAFQKRWCPEGVANDPDNLNKNWLGNALNIYQKFCEQGGIG